MKFLHRLVLAGGCLISSFAGAAENRHEALHYSCSGEVAGISHELELFHDGAGGWGAPISGRGTVKMKREGIGWSDQRLIHEVYLRPRAPGMSCGLIAQFTLGDEIRFKNFFLEIHETCNRTRSSVKGTLRIISRLEENEIGKSETTIDCAIH